MTTNKADPVYLLLAYLSQCDLDQHHRTEIISLLDPIVRILYDEGFTQARTSHDIQFLANLPDSI